MEVLELRLDLWLLDQNAKYRRLPVFTKMLEHEERGSYFIGYERSLVV